MEAIVLCGGLGTRLQGVVPDRPKPMAPVAGRPFLAHLLDYWIAQGVRRFVLSVGHLHQAIAAHFGVAYGEVPVAYSVEAEPLGTGGGLFAAARLLEDEAPFLLLNGDTYFEVDLGKLRSAHRKAHADWTLSLVPATAVRHGSPVTMSRDDRVTSMDAPGTGAARLVNGGVYMVSPSGLCLPSQRVAGRMSLEAELMPALIRAGRGIYGMQSAGRFIDIGTPEEYRRAAGLLAA